MSIKTIQVVKRVARTDSLEGDGDWVQAGRSPPFFFFASRKNTKTHARTFR